MDLEEAITLFEQYVGEAPTSEEIATLDEGLARGKRMNRVITGLMSSRYHRRTKGPDGMKMVRAQREHHRGTGRGHRPERDRGDFARWRRAARAAIDAFFDALDEPSGRRGGHGRGHHRGMDGQESDSEHTHEGRPFRGRIRPSPSRWGSSQAAESPL